MRCCECLNDARLEFHLSTALLLEYEEVMRRDQAALGLTDDDVDDVLDGLCALATPQERLTLRRPTAFDPDDDSLVELALVAHADHLVTHNVADLRPAESLGFRVVTPREMLEILRGA